LSGGILYFEPPYITVQTTTTSSCDAQMAWKCLFTPSILGRRFWPVK